MNLFFKKIWACLWKFAIKNETKKKIAVNDWKTKKKKIEDRLVNYNWISG